MYSYGAKKQNRLVFMSSLPVVSPTISSFWEKVESVETQYKPEKPLIIRHKKVADRADELQIEMFHSCTRPDNFMTIFFDRPPQRVLDLGCGLGANSVTLVKKGSYVCGIDNDADLLNKYLIRTREVSCKSENIRLRRADITKLETYREYEKTFDLVIAVDVLPYLSPRDLRRTMEKIRDCMSERAHLVSTIFTVEGTPPHAIELGSKLGGHFYEGGIDFVSALLSESGFAINNLEVRDEGAIRFLATKIG